jgi:hypothetical protein
MKNFKTDFLRIVKENVGEYPDGSPELVLQKVVESFTCVFDGTPEEALELLSGMPMYGGSTGFAGGVNVDRQLGVVYVGPCQEGTWITLSGLVDVILSGGGAPDWWDDEWTTGETDEELNDVLAAEALEELAWAKRNSFVVFGTGDPIVTLQYSYDAEYIYQKRGRVITKYEISDEQYDYLNSLDASNGWSAAVVFCDASRGKN